MSANDADTGEGTASCGELSVGAGTLAGGKSSTSKDAEGASVTTKTTGGIKDGKLVGSKSKTKDKKAFDQYLAKGRITVAAKHYTKLLEQRVETKTSGSEVKLGGEILGVGASMSVTDQGTLTESVEIGPDGKPVKAVSGARSRGYAVDLFGLYSEYARSGQSFGGKNDGQGASVGMSVEADKDGNANKSTLAKSLGHEDNDAASQIKTPSSGAWSVEAHMDEATFERVVLTIIKGEARTAGKARVGEAAVMKLEGDLTKTASAYAAKKVLADFVKSYAANGLAFIRGLAGAGGLHDWVTLAPSPGKQDYFLKPAQYAAYTTSLAELEGAAKKPAMAGWVAAKCAPEIAELRQRVGFLTQDYYPDLPEDLLAVQRERTKDLLLRFQQLRMKILPGLEREGAQALDDLEISAETGAAVKVKAEVDGLRKRCAADDDALRKLIYLHNASMKEYDHGAFDAARAQREKARRALDTAYDADGPAEAVWADTMTVVTGDASAAVRDAVEWRRSTRLH